MFFVRCLLAVEIIVMALFGSVFMKNSRVSNFSLIVLCSVDYLSFAHMHMRT